MSAAEDLTFARREWVGRAMKRVEDPRMLTGAARYVGDLQPAGTLEAAFVRSPHPHARVGAIDATAARELPGVVAVYTAADLADTVPLAHLIDLEGAARTPRPALAGTKVRYVGEPVALVVAADRYVAEDAAELVDVDWEPLEPVPSIADARAEGAPVLHEELGSNCYYASSADTGATDDAFAGAAHVVSRRLHMARVASSAMEARGILASLDPGTEELTCWISSQAPFQQRYLLSLALGVPEHRIRVVAPSVGGAFGPKDFVFGEDVAVAWAALALRRPVRWIEDRNENLTAAPQAKEQEAEVSLAADADGRLLGLRASFTGDTGAYSYSAPGGFIDFMLSAASLPGPYVVGEYAWEVAGMLTSKAPVAPYRARGRPAASRGPSGPR